MDMHTPFDRDPDDRGMSFFVERPPLDMEELVRPDTDSRFWLGVARASVWAGFLGFMLLAVLVIMPK